MKRFSKIFFVVLGVIVFSVLWLIFRPNSSEHDFSSQARLSGKIKDTAHAVTSHAESSKPRGEGTSEKSNESRENTAKANSSFREVNPNPTKESLLRYFHSKSPGPWKARLNEKGKVFRIIGGEIPEVTRDVASVTSFFAEVAPEVGIPSNQLTAKIERDSTEQLDIYDSVQIYKGYEVFNSFFRVIGNKKTKNGFLFNNNTHAVNQAEVILPPAIGWVKAEEILIDHYGNRLSAVREKKGPLVFANKGQRHEIAYQFRVSLTDDDQLVLVGADSKRVIHNYSERIH